MAVLPYHPRPQVFLSYRGQQRSGTASSVTSLMPLRDMASTFFQDKDEQRAKDLKNLFMRIQESRIALVIFSDRYGESRWCLEELVKIKKVAEKGKLEVIPIFYNVKAREVRWPSGEFGDNFWALVRESSTGDEIKKWKEALEYISNKVGLSLGPKSSESDFIKKTITRRLEELQMQLKEMREEKRKIWDCSYEPIHFKINKTHKFSLCKHCNIGHAIYLCLRYKMMSNKLNAVVLGNRGVRPYTFM